jgi:hypothetical protein
LTNAYFYAEGVGGAPIPYLSAANLTAADARGATFPGVPQSALTANLIWPNGHIAGLDLTAGASLIVRDYDGNVPILVESHFFIVSGGTIQMLFKSGNWDSTISFAPGDAEWNS